VALETHLLFLLLKETMVDLLLAYQEITVLVEVEVPVQLEAMEPLELVVMEA
jgi:hypothetical protein